MEQKKTSFFSLTVIVAALGYFVDVYDLILFSILRIASLKDLGFSGGQLLSLGIYLLNVQMIGMLLGGIAFGILGDRFGRVVLLFGSILLYSVANIANGFVHSVEAYAVWRFIAGFGLAGELGGGITLVSEILSKQARGYGTMIVSAVGVFGAVIGALVANWVQWRHAYFIGGGLGLLLLVLRLSVAESGMFKQLRVATKKIARGNFLSLFQDRKRFMKYIRCILIGLPNWFAIGILVFLSPELANALKIHIACKVIAAGSQWSERWRQPCLQFDETAHRRPRPLFHRETNAIELRLVARAVHIFDTQHKAIGTIALFMCFHKAFQGNRSHRPGQHIV